MNIDIRPVEIAERRAANDAFRTALLTGPVSDELFSMWENSWNDGDWLAAWDGERCVANLGAFRFDTTVPGGARLATAGYSRVGVLPTHTRRGILTQLMQRSLREARERGQALASLRASEATIYGRFGFGLAGDVAAVVVTGTRAKPLRARPAAGSMRLLAMDQVLDVIPPLYDRVARRRIGTIGRPAWMWQRFLKEATEPTTTPFGKGAFVAVHSDPAGVDDGYVHYETDFAEEFGTNPTGVGTVHDLWGGTDAVELALWEYLFDLDLVTTWKALERPLHDPIRRSLHDTRAYETRQVIDEQWLRLLDVDAALGSRSFGPAAGRAVIAVTDPLFADNNGSWTLTTGGASRSSDPADITVDIEQLSTVYLGGVGWQDLAAAGRLPERVEPAVLEVLDALFSARPVTFCGSFF